jgi:hypothetical protein
VIIKIYIVRAQTAQSDTAYGPVRTLGDPYTDKDRAEKRAQQFREAWSHGHAFIETHWIEVTA